MIELVFTLDYEIYGNGQGSLRRHVYEPARRLARIFKERGARFVLFVEAAELKVIEAARTDDCIAEVLHQVKELHEDGFELGLHLHPQWCKATHDVNGWRLQQEEYNLCTLPKARIEQIIDEALSFLRGIVARPGFTPVSFRAGNWLFQPACTAAAILADRGIRVDSSVFAGGMQRAKGLDYRRSLRNGWYWRFSDDVEIPDSAGRMLELPIHTRMVPFWKMLTGKRLSIDQNGLMPDHPGALWAGGKLSRLADLMRVRYPQKLDFCRMTSIELSGMIEEIVRQDAGEPSVYRPIIAIGHTKDLVDFHTVESLLSLLKEKRIPTATMASVYANCARAT